MISHSHKVTGFGDPFLENLLSIALDEVDKEGKLSGQIVGMLFAAIRTSNVGPSQRMQTSSLFFNIARALQAAGWSKA